jgi:uncharacterized tellurite resistance protein B-like protein
MEVDNFQKSHFLNLFNIALSDNSVDPMELKELYRIGEESGVSIEEIDFIIENPHKVKTTQYDNDFQLFNALLNVSQMILADGKIDPREITLFKRILASNNVNREIGESLIEYLIDFVKADDSNHYSTSLVNDLYKNFLETNNLEKIMSI